MPNTPVGCTEAIFQSTDSPVEVAPGLWDEGQDEGLVCIQNMDEFDVVIEPGTKVAELHPAVTQTRACQDCGLCAPVSWLLNPLHG